MFREPTSVSGLAPMRAAHRRNLRGSVALRTPLVRLAVRRTTLRTARSAEQVAPRLVGSPLDGGQLEVHGLSPICNRPRTLDLEARLEITSYDTRTKQSFTPV